MKNVVTMEMYRRPWELEHAVARFVEDYNHQRLHESLDNMTRLASTRSIGRQS